MCFSPELKSWATNRIQGLSSFLWFSSLLSVRRVMEIWAALSFGIPIQHNCTLYSFLKDSVWITVNLKSDHPPGTLEISFGNCPPKLSPLKSISVLCPSQGRYLLQTGKGRLRAGSRCAEGDRVAAYYQLYPPLSSRSCKEQSFFRSSNRGRCNS